MIYTQLVNRAMQVAYNAHHGQTDHGGVPYIFHPMHIAEQMDDEISVCAALLHDVVEDTFVTIKDLERDFPPEIIEVVRLLTHDDDTDYFDYIRTLKKNPVARRIKLADLAHNSDETRLSSQSMSRDELQYFRSKYRRARDILESWN